MSDDFFSVAGRQRACRAFSAEPVEDGDLEQILTAATWAPSAENRQPWEFVVVRDPSVRAELGALAARAWRDGGRAFAARRLDPGLLADVDAGATGGVASAPVLIVVCADHDRGLPVTAASSVFPAVQNLLLAATALGLGSALTTLGTAGPGIAELLGLPASVQPMALVPVGRPARVLGPPRRDPARAHTHRDRYGEPW